MVMKNPLHTIELRTMPQGHPNYRFICQEMWGKIQFVIRRRFDRWKTKCNEFCQEGSYHHRRAD
jgi:hypothetical protein